jgi:erythromycin esterase
MSLPRLVALLTATSIALVACSSDVAAPPGPGGTSTPLLKPGAPAPWFGGSGRLDLYEVGIDAGLRHGGKAAAYARSKTTAVDTSSFATLAQSISAVAYRGRRVRMTGVVRADSITGPGAGLWMRIDGPRGTLGFDNMIGFDRAIVGTRDWTTYSVVLDVPVSAVGLTVGMLFKGRGSVRVDDVRIDVVDASVPTSGSAGPYSQTGDSTSTTNAYARMPAAFVNLDFEGVQSISDTAAVSWLAAAARPFTTDAPGSGFDDLAELGRIVGDARVVAFGEATHGTREFFRMKHRAFEYLVEKQGFTHFTIEATMPESRAMDRYVTLGEGDPAKLLSNLYFWTWNTQEVLDLVKWMRDYNVRVGAPKLRFVGFDMQSPEQSVDSVRTIFSRLDPALGVRANAAASCLAPARDASGYYTAARYAAGTSAQQRAACADSLAALGATVAAHRTEWAGALSADDLDWAQQYVTLLRQWERMAASSSGSIERDRAMAENIAWITEKNPAARIFAWAHNGHVGRKANAMGSFVDQRLGAQYRVFGFTFGTGTFNAVTLNSSGISTGLQQQAINTIDSTAIESVFTSTRQQRLIFDAKKIAAGGSAASLFTGAVRMRSIGAVYSDDRAASFFDATLLPGDYDALIWFASTTKSTLLPFK